MVRVRRSLGRWIPIFSIFVSPFSLEVSAEERVSVLYVDGFPRNRCSSKSKLIEIYMAGWESVCVCGGGGGGVRS